MIFNFVGVFEEYLKNLWGNPLKICRIGSVPALIMYYNGYLIEWQPMLDYIIVAKNGTYSFKNLVTTVEIEVDIFKIFFSFSQV